MKFTPGIRLSLTLHGLPTGQVELLCTAAAGPREVLLARNVVEDSETALRLARDFIDTRMDHAAAAKAVADDPTKPHPDDLF